MAITRRFRVTHGDVFPRGAYLIGEVAPVWDFDKSTKDVRVQAVDQDSGLTLWAVDIVDGDPAASRREKTVSVKIASSQQPVPPANESPLPFTAVEFTGLTALPYLDNNGDRPRIAWCLVAHGLAEPGTAGQSSASGAL